MGIRFCEGFVNSSVGQFTETVRAVMDRFPYYDRGSAWGDWEAAGNDLMRLIEAVDPEAAIPDRFWSTFVDDVKMGDFDTRSVVEEML